MLGKNEAARLHLKQSLFMIVFTLHQAIVCDLKYENELTSLAFLKKTINNICN